MRFSFAVVRIVAVAIMISGAGLGIATGVRAQVETIDPDLLTEAMRGDATYVNGNEAMACPDGCQVIRQAERRPIPNEVTSSKFQSELLHLREETGLWQRLKNSPIQRLARASPEGVFLTVAALGYGVNRKWVRLGYRMGPAGEAGTQFSDPRLVWSDDAVIADGAPPSGGAALVLPGKSWHFVFHWDTSDVYRWLDYGDGVQCNHDHFPTPRDMVIVSMPRPDSCFIEWDPYPNPVFASGTAKAAYAPLLRVVDWGDWPPPHDEYDTNVPGGDQTQDSFEKDREDIESELGTHPADYPTLLPWLEYMLSGKENLSDPLGVGGETPDISFPDVVRKWEDHGHEFPTHTTT